MAKIYLQVKLAVRPTGGGAAELVPPPELEGVDYRFVVVKDGAEEGVVAVDEAPSLVARLQKSAEITRLTNKQLEKVRSSYPPPRLKQKHRVPVAAEGETRTAVVETDEKGHPIEDTVQTVRSGFYLIDVPVTPH